MAPTEEQWLRLLLAIEALPSRGRPAVGGGRAQRGGGGASPRVAVRLPEELVVRLRARARLRRTSVSQVVREALEAHLR